VIEFYWQVPECGCEWVTGIGYPDTKFHGPGVEGLFLTERVSAGDRKYRLVEKTGLFKTFASTDLSREGVLQFANLYGLLLNKRDRIPLRERVDEKPEPFYLAFGEAFLLWEREILLMRHAIDVWEKAKVGDSSSLGKFISWHGSANETAPHREVRYRGPKASGDESSPAFVIASKDNHSERLARFTDGDTVEPAMYAVQQLVNNKMEEHGAIPGLFWDRTPRGVMLRVHADPRSLIAGLWVQFAYAIEGNRDYRNCDQCKKSFEVAAEKRADARFCSNGCRFKAYRSRQKEAQRLHSEGLGVKAIAEKLGAEINAVKGWVKK
jgi:hypothetical protein